jgi:cytochrome c553
MLFCVSRFSRLGHGVIGLAILLFAGSAFAAGDVAAGKARATACAACHGPEGKPVAGVFPALAGQSADYLMRQLHNFKSGARQNDIMKAQAAGLSDRDIQNLAAYFSSLPPRDGAATDPARVKQGERIYRGGIAKNGVAACMSCHGPSGAGIPSRFPRVSGQLAGYAEQQLLAFKSGARKSDGNIMTDIAFRMSEGDIRAVADYMSGLR